MEVKRFKYIIYRILILLVAVTMITGCQTSVEEPVNNNDTATEQTEQIIDKSQIPAFSI